MDSQEMPNKRRKKSSQKFAFAFAMLSGFCITKALNANWVEFFWFEDENADNAKNCLQKLSLFFKNN